MATITHKVIFDLDNSKVRVEDHTNYSSGYSGAIHGVVSVTKAGSAFNTAGTSGSPDLTIPATDYTPSTPLQSTRIWEAAAPSSLAGVWAFDYSVYPSGGSATIETATQIHFVYEFAAPSVSLGLVAQTAGSQITSTDSTDYTSGGVYTVTSQTRVHNLIPPQGATDAVTGALLPSPVDTGSSATINYTGITTGNWTSDVSSVMDYNIAGSAGSYNVWTTLTGFANTNVVSDLGLCDVYCCLKALNLRYEDAKCKNKSLAEEYKAKIEDVTRLVSLYTQALNCGNTSDAEVYLNDIKIISECSTECACYGGGSTPANLPITSAVSSNSYKLMSANSNIVLESSGSGTSADPVVYSMSLGPEIQGDISYIASNLSVVENELTAMNNLATNIQSVQNNASPGFDMQTYKINISNGEVVGNTADANLINNTFKTSIDIYKFGYIENVSRTNNNNSTYATKNGVLTNSSKNIDSVIATIDDPSLYVDITSINNTSFSDIGFRILDKETKLPKTPHALTADSPEIEIILKIIVK